MLRLADARHPTVGKNCLSVTMRWNKDTHPDVLIRGHLLAPLYHQTSVPHAGFVLQGPYLVDAKDLRNLVPPTAPPTLDGQPVAYTPWIIWPTLVVAPSAADGEFCFGPKGHTGVRIEGPPSENIHAGLLAFNRRPLV